MLVINNPSFVITTNNLTPAFMTNHSTKAAFGGDLSSPNCINIRQELSNFYLQNHGMKTF